MGVSPHNAWIIARSGKGVWRLSDSPPVNQAMSNKWFAGNGLISLEKTYLSL